MPKNDKRNRVSPLELRKSSNRHSPISKTNNYDCRVCNRDHPLRKCIRFHKMNISERLKVVNRFKYCENCPAHSHRLATCHNTTCCCKCGAKHHTLLHRPDRLDIPTRSCKIGSVTVIPTVIIKVKLKNNWSPIRGILHPCAEFSSIASFIVRRNQLPVVVIDGCEWATFSFQSHFEDGPLFRVTAKVTNDLPTLPGRRNLDENVAEYFQNLRLADPQFYRNAEINIVLGADMYPQLIRGGIQPQSLVSAMAQDTKLGWTIIGKLAQ